MKKSRFTEEQIILMLKQAESGRKVEEICRENGVSNWTFYQWRKKYLGMTVPDAKRMKALEEENRRLKRIVADQALDLAILKDVTSKKW